MHSSWQAAAKMKRMRPDDVDDGQDQRFGLTGQASDVPVPSLTIRYPPVFDDDVSSQQFQYMQCRPRRQSYPPFNPSSQTYPTDRYFEYPQRPWQDTQGEQEAGSCYEAVDFSMNRDASRGIGPQVHSVGVTPSASCVPSASFHSAGTNASPSHTPGRSVQDIVRGTPTFQPPDQVLRQMPLVSPSSEPYSFTLLHGSSVFQRNEPSYLSGPSYQHRSFPEGAAPPCQGTRALPVHVPDLPVGLTSAEEKPCHQAEESQQLVYYNLDTPQSNQAVARDLVTAHYQIEDDSMGVPLHLRPLLSHKYIHTHRHICNSKYTCVKKSRHRFMILISLVGR
ncbi:uncharacterized protein LOC124255270 [Haliotis rubra]|uniref:uncharacterized protein LOC124255270 n=1 Tax=Haliotis rubra TaxID=36100 RepID=UPI001EE52D28|nr:uncharacterized protein LOC124255270 [Haliotis rubra]